MANIINSKTTGTGGIEITSVDTSGVLNIQSGGTTAVTVDASGNVGIGVTPNTWSLGKVVELNSGGNALWSAGPADIRLNAGAYYNGAYKYGNTGSLAATYEIGGGTHIWRTAPSGTINNTITFTQAMTLNPNGNLALQGGTTTATGVGITFPATQSASTDANCLDDYEEGTWTPTWSVSGGTITANGWTSGKYTKVGSTVYLWGYISYNSHTGSPSGQLSITNFPFAAGGGFGQSSTFSGGLTISAGGLWASGMPSFADIKPASNSGLLQYYGATGGTATTFANMTQNGNYSQFIFFGQYTV